MKMVFVIYIYLDKYYEKGEKEEIDDAKFINKWK